MRTVLITGASGFIGRRTVRACLARGWRVIGLDRHPSAFAADAYTHLVHAVTPDEPLPVPLIRQTVDAAILLAWPVDPARYLQSSDNLEALAATLALARAMINAGCRTLVGVGTCAEYAPAEPGIRLREDHAVRPDTLYAACKTAAHQVLEQLVRPAQATITWARIFNPFGPGESAARLLPSIARRLAAGEDFLAGSGSQVRDYLHVDDIAAGLATCLDGGLPGAVNVCSGQGMVLAEMMTTFAMACGSAGKVVLGAKADRPWDPPHLVGDPGRLLAAGWKPRDPLPLLAEYARSLVSTSPAS